MTNADMARSYLQQAEQILQEAKDLNRRGAPGTWLSDGRRKWLNWP